MTRGSDGSRRSHRIRYKVSFSKFTNDEATAVDLTVDSEEEEAMVELGTPEPQQGEGDRDGGAPEGTNRNGNPRSMGSISGENSANKPTISRVVTMVNTIRTNAGQGTMETPQNNSVRNKPSGAKSTKSKETEIRVESDERKSKKRKLDMPEKASRLDKTICKKKEINADVKKGKSAQVEGSKSKSKKRLGGVRGKATGRKGKKDKQTYVSDSESDDKGVGKSVFPGLRIRTSPKPLLVAVRCMSELQKKCVEDMGFGTLLNFQIDELPAKLAYFVVDNFNEKSMEIRLNNGTIQVSVESIHDILGIPVGGTRLDSVEDSEPDSELMADWWGQFGKVKDVSAGQIKKRIVLSNEADWNFKLNFVALLSNTLGVCKMRGKADLTLLKYIRRETNFRAIDWCHYFWRLIHGCKAGWKFETCNKYFAGPATILTLLYLDGTKCTQIPVDRLRPAILAWNYELMSYREEEEIENGGFGMLEILGNYHAAASPGNCEHGQQKDQVGSGNSLSPIATPQNVEEYLAEMASLATLIQKSKRNLEKIVQEAIGRYPDHDGVKEWIDKMGMIGVRAEIPVNDGNENTTTNTEEHECRVESELNQGGDVDVCKKTNEGASGSCMGGGNVGEVLSQFWFSSTLDRSVTKAEMDAALRSTKVKRSMSPISGPSFSMGWTQEIGGNTGKVVEESPPVKATTGALDPIPISIWVRPPSDVARVLDRGKRTMKLPAKFKSPFTKRVTDIGMRLSVMETKVWKLINDGVGSYTDIVFGTKEGRESVCGSVRSLAQDSWITVDVIDSWAAMLNHDEEKRSNTSPYRLFCHTGMMIGGLEGKGKDDGLHMKIFMANLGEVVDSNPALMSLKDVDMVFFPMLQHSHYYLICYNLKTSTCDIIDNQLDRADVKQKYKQEPEKLHALFVEYLKMVGHSEWEKVMGVSPTRMAINWRTTDNWDDCGVFLMRHMECYMGEVAGKWDCGFDMDSGVQKRQLSKLRRKYTAKLLMSPHNVHRALVVKEAMDYAAKSKKS